MVGNRFYSLGACTRAWIRARRLPQNKIFEPEFAFAGRDRRVTSTVGDKQELAFPPRSASQKEEMEKGLASAFVIRWPIWPSGPRRE